MVTFVTYVAFAQHLSSSEIDQFGMGPTSASSYKEIAGG